MGVGDSRNAGTGICLARYGFGFRFDGSELDGTELSINEAAAILGLMKPLHVQT
jgi:hypothetical protein